MYTILLFAFLQAPVAPEPLRSGCSIDDQQIAMVSPADNVQVQMAFAGGATTCYKVILSNPGQTLTGYVLGESLPAIATFVQLRQKTFKESAEAQARLALLPPPAAKNGDKEVKALDPNVPSHIDDFSWRDSRGRGGSLSSLGGRVTLVTFWPANGLRSKAELNSIQPLYNELHRNGLAAVGVSMDPNPRHMNEVLDDTNFSWPQVPDRSGLAAQYHVNPSTGVTFVLDASHRVVAAGPMGADIEKAVRKLLAAP